LKHQEGVVATRLSHRQLINRYFLQGETSRTLEMVNYKIVNKKYPVRDLSSVENDDKSMLRTEHCRFFIEQTATRAPRIGAAFFYRIFMPAAM
jgi:hypothetical protein